MSLTLSIAVEYLMNRRKQTVLSVLGVAMGVAFFIAITGLMQGMHNYFIDRLVDASPHVKIMDEFRNPPAQPVYDYYPDGLVSIRGLKPKAELRGIRNVEKILPVLARRDDLAISPILRGQAFLRYGGKDLATSVIGINPAAERRASQLDEDLIVGNLNNLLTNSNGIILGKALADKLGLDYGAKLSVVSPAGVTMNMKVVGIFETGVTEFDGNNSYALLKKVQVLQDKDDTINQINIKMRDVNAAPQLAASLEQKFGYKVESWQETYANIFDLFVVQNSVTYSMVIAIVLVSGFGIYNIISTAVSEKNRDIAILKSMGFSEPDITKIFLHQGIIVGIIGTVVGWLFGAFLVEVLASIDLTLEEETLVKFDGFPIYRAAWLYWAAGGMAIVIAAFSAWLPARKAAQLHPVDIIRGAA